LEEEKGVVGDGGGDRRMERGSRAQVCGKGGVGVGCWGPLWEERGILINWDL